MSGAIATTALIAGGIGAAGSIGGAALSSHAAGKAADAQSAAANHAADLQYQASQQALDFQKQQWNTQQQNLAPWLKAGGAGLSNLQYLLGVGGDPNAAASGGNGPSGIATPVNGGMGSSTDRLPGVSNNSITPPSNWNLPNSGAVSAGMGSAMAPLGVSGARPMETATPAGAAPASPVNTALGGYGSLMQPYSQQFVAPDALTEQNDPGYQARLNLGMQAMDRSAAARGSVLTGGTVQAENQAAQDYASNEYGNVYNRAFNQYAQNYNQYEQNQANQYNRLASLAGVGQQTAQQLGLLGNQASQNVSSNLLGTAANMGQDYQNAGAANASGYVGGANAWSGALGGTGNNLSNLLMLKQLGGLGGGVSNSNPAIYGGGSLYGV